MQEVTLFRNIHFGLMAFVLLAIISTSYGAGAQTTTLEGLAGIRVEVQVDPSLTEEGLNAKLILADAESRLQREKIQVLSEEQWRTVDHHPLLLIRIDGARVQENWNFYTFAINIYLLQDVLLIRESESIRHQAATWFTSIAGCGYFGDIQTRVNELVDRFSTKFREANS
jgi:hypothetical protein